jgi:RimJ/RimL family protein N-acetyltransferase
MFIRSERLFLRPSWPEDREELRSRIPDTAIIGQELLNPPALAPASPNLPDHRLPQFLVTLPSAGGTQLIGGVGLVGGGDGAELGCWIAREHGNQGYATEAARAVLRLARTLGHRQVTAIPSGNNPAANRVLAKLGFRATGATRRTLCSVRGTLAAAMVHLRDLGEPGEGDGCYAA